MKKNLSEKHTGKKLSEKHKENIRKTNMGKPSGNRIKSKITNIKTGEVFEAESLLKLSEISSISLATLGRIKKNKNSKKYILE